MVGNSDELLADNRLSHPPRSRPESALPAMQSHKVVPGKSESADRCRVVETNVLAMPIVVVKPTRQVLFPLGRVFISEGIGPLAQRRLDKALSLSIGQRRIRTSEPMSDPQVSAHRGELP